MKVRNKKIKKGIVLVLLVCLVWVVGPVLAFEIPGYENWVTDRADIYSPEFEEKLNNKIGEFEIETEAEIAVLTISKLPEASIEEYAVEVFEKWGIGKEGEDNGILLIIAKDNREIKIEVGYGLEGKITDGMAGRIIRDELTPQFKLENYEQGTEDAVEAMMGYIKGDMVNDSKDLTESPVDEDKLFGGFKVIILGGLFLIYMASFLGRSREFITGGIVGFIIGLFFSGLIVGIVLGIFGLILDMILSSNFKNFKSSGRPTGFWGSKGGFKSPGSKSSGGFGGFGGGSSGGGGASGKW